MLTVIQNKINRVGVCCVQSKGFDPLREYVIRFVSLNGCKDVKEFCTIGKYCLKQHQSGCNCTGEVLSKCCAEFYFQEGCEKDVELSLAKEYSLLIYDKLDGTVLHKEDYLKVYK